jgi:hypothetical protein
MLQANLLTIVNYFGFVYALILWIKTQVFLNILYQFYIFKRKFYI